MSENLSGLPSCKFDNTVTDADSASEGKAFSRKSIIKSFVATRKFGATTHTKNKKRIQVLWRRNSVEKCALP